MHPHHLYVNGIQTRLRLAATSKWDFVVMSHCDFRLAKKRGPQFCPAAALRDV